MLPPWCAEQQLEQHQGMMALQAMVKGAERSFLHVSIWAMFHLPCLPELLLLLLLLKHGLSHPICI